MSINYELTLIEQKAVNWGCYVKSLKLEGYDPKVNYPFLKRDLLSYIHAMTELQRELEHLKSLEPSFTARINRANDSLEATQLLSYSGVQNANRQIAAHPTCWAHFLPEILS